jgi:thiamine biosynthesis lipoprotein
VTALALPGVRRVEQIMGMPIVVDVRDEVDDEIVDAVFAWFDEVDRRFSTFKPDSEVSRIAAGTLRVEDAHPDVREVLARCDELRDETRGYFDAYAQGRLDPSGLVKGWSVDRAAALLDGAGVRNYGVNAGGDIRLRGAALPDDRWRVGIQHPHERDRVAKVVECTDLAVATSGGYARGGHVRDPHTGAAPSTVLSVTITGRVLATADAYATAAFAMDGRGPAWTARLPRGYEALSITADGRVLSTPGFPATG